MKKDEYVRWVQDYDHGLHVSKIYSEFVFDLQYEPYEYVLLQRGAIDGSQEKLAAQQGKDSDIQVYVLSVGMQNPDLDFMNYNIHDPEEHQRKLYYFSYTFQNDIVLEENGKELPCVLYHFERSADLKKYYTVVLGFENPVKDSKESTLVLKSEQLNSLPIKIKVSKKNIPTLDI